MRTYLDHNATSPLRKEAKAALLEALEAGAGNASSMHAEGRAAKALIEAARAEVAALSGVSPREVVFTSGGSESIAAAIRGITDRSQLQRIVVSSIEHSAVLEGVRALGRKGLEVVEVACERSGRVDPERFAAALEPGAALAALQAANNETGVVQPVAEVEAACRERRIPLLIDAVQAAGKIAIPRADLVALSGHKLGGPQGTGALLVREGLAMAPLVHGGAQERRRRGGTEAVAALSAFGAACEAARRDLDGEHARLQALRTRLERGLRAFAPNLRIHGEEVERLPNTTNVAFPGASGEILVIALDLAGIAVSSGSACHSGAAEPSHVLRAMGYDDAEARGALRFSLGWSTGDDDVDRLLRVLPAVLAQATMAGR